MSDSTLVRHGHLSEFARRQFEAAGLEDVAVRVSKGELLTRQDTERLAEVALPLLAKLVSLRPDFEPCLAPSVDPVFYLPNCDVAKTVDTIRVAVVELAALIDHDNRVQEFGDCVRALHVLVDSAVEAACRIHETVNDQLAGDAERLAIRVFFAGQGSGVKPASQTEAAHAMREVVRVYLQSPAGTEVRAPIGELGIKTAHVALTFGANHLGQAALDQQTAEVLRIPTLIELADALRYDTPTPI